MSANEKLARWREAEQGATEGPWGYHVASGGVRSGNRRMAALMVNNGLDNVDADGRFIATSREAMPALLAFAEAVLRWADDHVEGYVNVDEVDRLAEQHLGGAPAGDCQPLPQGRCVMTGIECMHPADGEIADGVTTWCCECGRISSWFDEADDRWRYGEPPVGYHPSADGLGWIKS